MVDSPILTLKKDIDAYLQWMIANGYSFSTYGKYRSEFNKLLIFIIRRQIDWEDIFTHDTLKEFTKSAPVNQGTAVRKLWQYLYDQKRIPHPIDPPRPKLPDIYEGLSALLSADPESTPISARPHQESSLHLS